MGNSVGSWIQCFGNWPTSTLVFCSSPILPVASKLSKQSYKSYYTGDGGCRREEVIGKRFSAASAEASWVSCTLLLMLSPSQLCSFVMCRINNRYIFASHARKCIPPYARNRAMRSLITTLSYWATRFENEPLKWNNGVCFCEK